MSVALQIKMLQTCLDFFFETELTEHIVHEATIHEVYNRQATSTNGGRRLAEILEQIGISLPDFIRQKFPDRFHYVPDEYAPCFISTHTIRSADGIRALTAASSASAKSETPSQIRPHDSDSSAGQRRIGTPPGLSNALRQFAPPAASRNIRTNLEAKTLKKYDKPAAEIVDLSSAEEATPSEFTTFRDDLIDLDLLDGDQRSKFPNEFRQTPPANVVRPQPIHADGPPDFKLPKSKGSTSSTLSQIPTLSGGYTEAITVPMDHEQEVEVEYRRRHNSSAGTELADSDLIYGQNGILQRVNQECGRGSSMSFGVETYPNSRFFYNVFQGSITNSSEVKVYRENNYDILQRMKPELFTPMPSNLKFLLDHGENLGPLIHTLQQLHMLFPNGLNQNDLIAADRTICEQESYFGNQTPIMSLIECIDLGLLQRRSDELYHVLESLHDIQLWHLPRGLTSNLYRILSTDSYSLVQDIIRRSGVLLDKYGEPVTLYEEDIVRQANCWPLLFSIQAQAAEQHSMRTAIIMLDKRVPKWKVMLDSMTPDQMIVLCDCNECTNGNPPVLFVDCD